MHIFHKWSRWTIPVKLYIYYRQTRYCTKCGKGQERAY